MSLAALNHWRINPVGVVFSLEEFHPHSSSSLFHLVLYLWEQTISTKSEMHDFMLYYSRAFKLSEHPGVQFTRTSKVTGSTH